MGFSEANLELGKKVSLRLKDCEGVLLVKVEEETVDDDKKYR
jgi:hypothetical protein